MVHIIMQLRVLPEDVLETRRMMFSERQLFNSVHRENDFAALVGIGRQKG